MRFYGTNQDGYIDIVSNAEPAQVKIWNTMSLNTLYTNQTDTSALSIPATDTTIVDQSMTSGVQTSNSYWTSGTGFVYKEQQAFTDYMRTIPRPTGATNFIEGDKVRGYWQRTRIKFAGGTVKMARIISATFNYFMSNYTR
jgi:predicted oxidoreductase